MMIHRLKKDAKLIVLMAMVIVIAGCSDDGSSAALTSTPVATLAAAETPALVLSGIAAVGAALDGATLEIIDASGNLVDIPDTLTGSDGSYQVTLPANITLPVIVRITPLEGEPLLNVVPEPAPGTTEIVANVNPITNLVAEAVLGDVDSANAAALASSLAIVDTTTLDETSNEVVGRVLGSGVDYATFATAADFVANNGATSGSAADTILDTLAKNAEDNGLTLSEQLADFAEREEPPKLLEDPVFQVVLVSLLIQGGADSANLESDLASIGALTEVAEGEADIFRTIIETLPVIIESTKTNAASLAGNPDLQDIAVNAAVALVANTVKQKAVEFFAGTADLVELLESPSFQETAVDVIILTVVPVLETFVNDPDVDDIQSGLEMVVDSITTEAANVASSFEYTATSTDVSDLVAGFVQDRIAPKTSLNRDDLLDIQTGTSAVAEKVTKVADAVQVQDEIQSFSQENPDLVQGSVLDLIDVVPPKTWGEAKWDSFNWG
jgi:hypothetical protein